MKKTKYKMLFECTETGYSAFHEDLAVYTTGKDLLELKANSAEALSLYFEDGALEIKESQIELVFHLDAFFKRYRALNANFLAEKIGMHATLLSLYIQGTKIPSAKQLAKIQEGIHSLGKELQEVNLI